MKIKTPTEFLTFNDGVCEIWSVSRNELENKLHTLRYGSRNVSLSRFVEMSIMSAAKLDMAIHVYRCSDIAQAHRVVIDGIQYKIERAQHLRDTNPPVTVLYLTKIGKVSKT